MVVSVNFDSVSCIGAEYLIFKNNFEEFWFKDDYDTYIVVMIPKHINGWLWAETYQTRQID